MTATSNELEEREIQLTDLVVEDAEAFFELGFRRAEATALVCRLPSLGHTSVVVCAPLDRYLCGVQEYPQLRNALYTYTTAELISSDAFYDAFLGTLKKAGIKKELVPKALFAPYAQWGAYGTEMRPAFGKLFRGLSFDRRITSALVPDSLVNKVIDHWRTQITQFGDYAWCDAPESLNRLIDDPAFSEIPDRSSIAYESEDYDALVRNSFVSEEDEEHAVTRLREIVACLEIGDSRCVRLFPLHVAKATPGIHLGRKPRLPRLTWERVELRAKATRLLGWPWHYPSIKSQLDAVSERRRLFRDEEAFLQGIEADLRNYMIRMEEKYPVILQNPLLPTATA